MSSGLATGCWLALAFLPACRESVVPANTARTATVEEANAIRGTMQAYEQAALAHRGAEASDLVSRRTIDCYERLRQLALHADRAKLRAASLMDRIRALGMRARYSTGELQGMADGSFARFVDDGQVNIEDLAGWSFGAIDVEGDRALATYISKRHGKGPKMTFHLQDGRWRLDLEAMTETAGAAYEAQLLRNGRPLEETVLVLVGEMVGRELDDSIWTPALPR